MQMEWVNIVISNIAITAVLVSVASFGFKMWSEKWMQSKFDRSMEAFKQEHRTEIEHLRFEISRLLDRASKLNNYEFDVLPEAWKLMEEARGSALLFVSSFREYPHLDRMDDFELEEFLEASELTESQKNKIKESDTKTDLFMKQIYWHEKHATNKYFAAFRNYRLKYSIFISSPIKEMLQEMDKIISAAVFEYETDTEDEVLPKSREKKLHLEKRGEELRALIEEEIQNRLWNVSIEPQDQNPGSVSKDVDRQS